MQTLEIVPSYHPNQFKEKLLNQTSENGEKSNLATNFDPSDPNLGPPKFFSRVLLLLDDIVASYHCMQFEGKPMIQTE